MMYQKLTHGVSSRHPPEGLRLRYVWSTVFLSHLPRILNICKSIWHASNSIRNCSLHICLCAATLLIFRPVNSFGMKLQLTNRNPRRTHFVDENHYQVYSTHTPIVLGKQVTTIKRAEGGGRVTGTIQWVPFKDTILTANDRIVDLRRIKRFSLSRYVIVRYCPVRKLWRTG